MYLEIPIINSKRKTKKESVKMGPTNQIKTRQRREPKKENVKPKGPK